MVGASGEMGVGWGLTLQGLTLSVPVLAVTRYTEGGVRCMGRTECLPHALLG